VHTLKISSPWKCRRCLNKGTRHRRTLSNWIREFGQFMTAPFARGLNLDRYERELRRPFPSAPRFAAESAIWRCEHDRQPRRPFPSDPQFAPDSKTWQRQDPYRHHQP